jgi:hypothetical protein
MAEAFGLKSKKKTKDEDYKFPMQIPYIEKMQDKDKLIMKELMKSDHKYELTKIERTAVLTLNGKIFILTAMRNPVIDWYHQYLCNWCYAHRSNNPKHYDVARVDWERTIPL